MLQILKNSRNRLLGRPVLPSVRGVAGPDWYDAAYRATEVYAVPYWQSHYYFLWTVLADRVRRDRLARVLDIGCGSGQFAACLFDLATIQSYAGLDFSTEAVAMARRACPRGSYTVGDARTTTIHLETPHDVVICTEVLEHVAEDIDVLTRFRPGVRCLCTVPNFPFDSHVRHFKDVDEVIARYAWFFKSVDVLALRGHHSPDHVYFLLDGIRNDVGVRGPATQ